MGTVLDNLLEDIDLGVVSQRTMDELRDVRDRLGDVEAGLSLGRRLIQGRLDIVMAELERRDVDAVSAGQPIGELAQVLGGKSRGSGSPRPVRDRDVPAFTDEISLALEAMVPAEQLPRLHELATPQLWSAVEALRDFETSVSRKRQEVHRVIDDLQEEIVGRYRSGAASVDDLLQ